MRRELKYQLLTRSEMQCTKRFISCTSSGRPLAASTLRSRREVLLKLAAASEKVHIPRSTQYFIEACLPHQSLQSAPHCYQMLDHAFASLTPANALARLAFSEVYDALTFRRQDSQTDGTQAALRHMRVEPKQICDDEIVRLRREMERTKNDTDGEASETLTEPDTDTEELLQELGMIWAGRYLLSLESQPAEPESGWRVGKGPLENIPIDLVLCTRAFAKLYDIDLRNPHARFNFSLENKGLFVIGCSRSPTAQLTVNGNKVMRSPYHLNQYEMKIQLDKFEYDFQWTKFAATDPFLEARTEYMDENLGGWSAGDINVEMPTPLPSRRTVGNWTLGGALGAGIRGRVFFASDSSGNIAAIKMLERTSRNCHHVDQEVQTFQELTGLLTKSPEGERVLRMDEVIYTNNKEFSSEAAFDNVAMVLTPMTPQTFLDLMGTQSTG